MKSTEGNISAQVNCSSCNIVQPGLFKRYRKFLLSPGTLITLINVLLMALGFIYGLIGKPVISNWLYLSSAIIGGAPVFKLAIVNIFRHFDLTAGVMVSIAMIAALIVGEYSAAAMVAFMMLFGEMLENMTIARADNALNELEQLLPATVIIKQKEYDKEVSIETVKPGDIAIIHSGSRIPVDGCIQSGSAAIDQSSITGESVPVDKNPGDVVYAGTICTAGALEIVIEKIGEKTTLGHMIELVKEARSTQSPVQRVANKYAQYLTPLALFIAVITFFITKDIIRSITVLIVICPCSLVLATPTAIIAAIGNATKRGVLVKNGSAFELIGKVDVVAFDKTGTLTLGELKVTDTISLNGLKPSDILSLAASVERLSEHPLARAIVSSAKEKGLQISDTENFQTMPGHGVSAIINDSQVIVGKRMLDKHGIEILPIVLSKIETLESQGNTVIPVGYREEIAGLILITDSVRKESGLAIAKLKQLGIKETILISGDNKAVVQVIGESLGVDHIYAEMLPEQKLDLITSLQSQNKTVAFVGDGVNDAPALAAADVGIAMGTIGTSIAIETADVVLLTDKLKGLTDLIELSQAGLITIRNNVIFAMGMNLLSVALSVGGIIGPVFGAIMHEVSALPVIANSVRLLGWKSKK